MAEKTSIEWAQSTWNPLVGTKGRWHCTKVSPGCAHCYAERLNVRFGGPKYVVGADKIRLDEHALTLPLRWRKPRRIFVCVAKDTIITMADGSLRTILAVKVGDLVLGYHNGKLMPSTVLHVKKSMGIPFTVQASNSQIRASEDHRFLVRPGIYRELRTLTTNDDCGILLHNGTQRRHAVSFPPEVGIEEAAVFNALVDGNGRRAGIFGWFDRRGGYDFPPQAIRGIFQADSRDHKHRRTIDKIPAQILLAKAHQVTRSRSEALAKSQPDWVWDKPIPRGNRAIFGGEETSGADTSQIYHSSPTATMEDSSHYRNAETLSGYQEAELGWVRCELIEKGRSPEILFDLTTSTQNFFANGFLTHNCSMTDLFEERVLDTWLDRIFAVTQRAPQHSYLVLTKRAERMPTYFGDLYRGKRFLPGTSYDPFPNLWLGVSCENQQYADERIPWLLQTPAAVRFVSCEPLLGPVHLSQEWRDYLAGWAEPRHGRHDAEGRCVGCPEPEQIQTEKLDFVIVGGESGGPPERALDIGWLRNIADQCTAAHVPLFVKQDSGRVPGRQGRIPDDLWQRKEVPRERHGTHS